MDVIIRFIEGVILASSIYFIGWIIIIFISTKDEEKLSHRLHTTLSIILWVMTEKVISFVVPEPVKVITFGMVFLNSSANKVTCEVLFVRMIGVRPESTTLQISFTMRLFRTVSSESDWYIAVMVCLSSVIDRYDVNLGIRYLSKDCLAI